MNHATGMWRPQLREIPKPSGFIALIERTKHPVVGACLGLGFWVLRVSLSNPKEVATALMWRALWASLDGEPVHTFGESFDGTPSWAC